MINKSHSTGAFIRNRRKSMNMSQARLGVKVGFRQGQFVSNVERGLCQFPVEYIRQLSEALQVNPETIIELMTIDYKKNLEGAINDQSNLQA